MNALCYRERGTLVWRSLSEDSKWAQRKDLQTQSSDSSYKMREKLLNVCNCTHTHRVEIEVICTDEVRLIRISHQIKHKSCI